MTLAQQFKNMMCNPGFTKEELEAFKEKYVVSTGVCSLDWLVSYSRIFLDGSVWGFSNSFEYETELDNCGHNIVIKYVTSYC